VFQVSGSYRPAIVALVVFFLLGAFFLSRLDARRGIQEAGNTVPAVI
jgi:UMF1 family MFS transporter